MAYRINALLVAGSALAMVCATAAYAQDASGQAAPVAASGDATSDQPGGEIVVTARRVAENQQDVPMSLTAVTGNELREKDVQQVTDLQKVVPSLTVNTGLNRNNTTFAIRGQRGSASTAGLGGGPSVVPYFAEAPVYASGPGLFFDLQNIQVLNGPQGTLFGQNTTGGAILFEPARPTNKFEGYLMGTYGSYNRLDVEGVVNIPIISDVLLFRGGIQRQTREGFSHDVVSKRDYDNRDSTVYRASLMFRPTNWLENYTVGSLYVSNEQGPAVVLLAANYDPTKPANVQLPLGPYIYAALQARAGLDVRHVALDSVTKDRLRSSSIVNRTTIDLASNLKLTNILSYGRYQTDSGRDDDGTPFPIQNSNGAYAPGTWNNDIVQFTEELRLTGKFGPLEVQTGGYYDRTSPGGTMTYTQQLQTVATTNQTDAELRGKSRALFGQIGLDMGKLTPALKGLNLTAGYRYTWNEYAVELDLLFYPGIFFPPPSPKPGDFCQLPLGNVYPNCHLAAAGKTSGDSFAFGADYKVTDKVLIFANYKKGYKPGGINPILIGLGGTVNSIGFLYKPEFVRTTELGIKTEWGAGNIRGHLNATGYINKYTDIQANVPLLLGNLTTGGTGNAAKATIKGIELEGDIRFGKLLSINAGYAYTDAHYDRYVLPTLPTPTDLTNLPFVYTPKSQFNVSANLTLPLPDSVGKIVLSGNYAWKGRTYVGDTDPTQPFSFVPAYGLAGARIDWNNFFNNGHMDLSFFVTNLTDKTYRTNVIQQYNATGYSTAIFGEPRMFGASLRARF